LPRIIGNLPADRWENEVLKTLKNQLPDDWVVMPSVKWTLQKNGYARDGEADFVVLAPQLGMVILEVKGSKEFLVGEDAVWRRMENDGSWVPLKEPPPEQAMRNMFDLAGVLQERNRWNDFPGRFAYLVVYPQGEARSLPAMFDESTIATNRHMNQLGSRLRHALETRGSVQRGAEFSASVVESIIDQLKNRKFHVEKSDTGEDVASDFEKINQLTRQQFASLRGLFQLPRVAVIGPAGSGKTVLAMWRLKAAIDQGLAAVYVCYNRVLSDALRLQNPEHAEYIWNIDRLFIELCPEGRKLAAQGNFHREVLPGMIMDRSATLPKYDVIIVDEGQDFSEEQVIALLDLLSAEGAWAFFADWKQDLYSAGKGTPIGAEVIFHLHHNCRNTVKINHASNSYLDAKVESMPGMPDGVPPLIESTNDQSKRAWELVKQWGEQGSVAILSPFKYENSAMKAQLSGHGFKLSTDIKDLGKKNTVYFSTVKSFKGIEAASIIVVDVGIPGEHVAFSREDLYVACTRATARLALLSSKKEIADYYRALG
jgi:hypothetical protein